MLQTDRRHDGTFAILLCVRDGREHGTICGWKCIGAEVEARGHGG